MSEVERYEASVRWEGSTGAGYEGYSRSHAGRAAAAEIGLTTGNRLGDPALMNPEQLVVMAAASCQLLWFLHLAAVARIDVLEYSDDATAEMPLTARASIARIDLRPRIAVRAGPTEERVLRLVELAHRECYVANTLKCPVEVSPTVVFR